MIRTAHSLLSRRPLLPVCGLILGLSACGVPVPPATTAVLAPKAAPVAAPAVVAMAPIFSAGDRQAGGPDLATAPAAVGVASWYRTGRRMHRTTSGEMLDNNKLTAASPVLPMGTMVRVSRLDGGASVLLLVNDRMPREGRILDVTEVAARDLGLLGSGVARVSVTPVMLADTE